MEQYQFDQAVWKCAKTFSLCLLAGCFMSTPLLAAEATEKTEQYGREKQWTLLAGYGISHTNIGNTKTQVQVLDLIPRFEKVLIGTMGESWYRGYHSLLLEVPLTWVFDPDTAPMIGVNILGSWTFDASSEIRPYFFGGGGLVYTGADIPGLGSELNGNWQFGGGVRVKVSDMNWMNFEYRFHHISNTGAEDPNDPINSSKFLLGLTF